MMKKKVCNNEFCIGIAGWCLVIELKKLLYIGKPANENKYRNTQKTPS